MDQNQTELPGVPEIPAAQDIEDPGNPSEATPPLAAPSHPPAGPSLSPELLGRALASGFDRQILDSMTQDQVEHALGVMAGQRERGDSAPDDPNPNEVPVPNSELDITISDELGSDGQAIVDAMKQQQAQLHRLATTVQRVTDTMSGHLNQMEHRDSDSYYASRQDLQHLFGTDPAASLNPSSPQMQNRTQVENLAKLYRAGYESSGVQPPAQDALRQQAINSLFASDVASQARETVRGEVQARQQQQMARPTSRQSPPAATSGKERAEHAVRAKLAQWGLTS